jgi:hypothetical protein
MVGYKCYADEAPAKFVSADKIVDALKPNAASKAVTPSHATLSPDELKKLPIDQLSGDDVRRMSQAQADARAKRPALPAPKPPVLWHNLLS